uniref:Neprosin PEP catalytic domain-containing protein n=2 Tax=Oryza TaxID=4527 RepID=A0A0E0RHG5_ORYRU
MATFDVYGFPNLNKDQVSSADLAVLNEQRHDLTDGNALFAGWMVDNGVSTGCYNLDRDGFVPVNNSPITPGDILEPTNGTLSITIKIFKKKDDGDWWLYFGHDNNNLSPVGFWLSSVLTNLADHANVIAWGGYTYTQSTTPSFPKCLTPLTFLNMFDHSFYSKTFMKYC